MIINSKFKIKNSKLQFKIQNFILVFTILIFAFCILNFHCYAQSVSSSELIKNAKQYDGRPVVYAGEVIGDVMPRGDFAWINVNDGESALGIWLDARLAQDINYAGNYKTRGDWIEVTGIFHRACGEHGGDLDIHAQSMRRINPGRNIVEKTNIDKRNQVFIWLGVLCLILILRQLKRK